MLQKEKTPESEGRLENLKKLITDLKNRNSLEEFIEEVDYMGATLNVSGSGVFASSLSRYFDRVLELMAGTVLEPLLTQEEFEKAKKKILN